MTRQHLIIDADDTLWENNIFFERAFDEFVDFLAHSSLTPPQVRDVLDAIEAVNAKVHGYGSINFGRNLVQTYEKLAQRDVLPADLDRIHAFAERILDHPIILRPGVDETLGYLRDRHELTLFTKGHPDEQRMKIERSGLAAFFRHAEIVKEKDVAAYLRLGEARSFHAPHTWMIGNSPKSDVNPALAAGFNAVFLPHPRTWILEREELAAPAAPARLLVLDHFGELRTHF
ncbi:MAG TPA: HAD family hydrolase [Bryobacteraceae bacterium]|nr:HAD family hydrolase [Bryobacteraceae bacterium]